jgi:hypothetical protein
MKSITRLSLALIMFSLFSISYLVTSVSAFTDPDCPPGTPAGTSCELDGSIIGAVGTNGEPGTFDDGLMGAAGMPGTGAPYMGAPGAAGMPGTGAPYMGAPGMGAPGMGDNSGAQECRNATGDLMVCGQNNPNLRPMGNINPCVGFFGSYRMACEASPNPSSYRPPNP